VKRYLETNRCGGYVYLSSGGNKYSDIQTQWVALTCASMGKVDPKNCTKVAGKGPQK
jgi:hypothetical protein